MIIAFWILVALLSVGLFICTEHEWGGLATFFVVAFAVTLNYVFKIPVFAFIAANPLLSLAGLAGYFVAGALWAFLKWFFYTRRQLEKYYEHRQEFLRSRTSGLKIGFRDPLPENLKDEWKSYRGYTSRYELNPQISEHKMSCYIWIAYWPFSMVWTLIDDPVRRLVKWIYRKISGTLQNISDAVWKNAKQELE